MGVVKTIPKSAGPSHIDVSDAESQDPQHRVQHNPRQTSTVTEQYLDSTGGAVAFILGYRTMGISFLGGYIMLYPNL